MGWLKFKSFALCLIFCLSYSRQVTCESVEMSEMKLELAKQSISNAKSLYPLCEDEDRYTRVSCSQKRRFIAALNIADNLISDAQQNCEERSTPQINLLSKPIDCLDIQNMGRNTSGIYKIWPRGLGVSSKGSIDVYCDMETDGGGWTVIQRRGKFSKLENFFVDWQSYKNGFGNLKTEFWIGNDNIYDLTHQGLYKARFDMRDVKGDRRYALYDIFWIEDENANYKLHVDKYSGSAGDAMAQSNLAMFSTKDRMNDKSGTDCPKVREGGFWYYNCAKCNPNGLYQPGKTNDPKSIYWWYWKGWDCLESMDIKLRRY